MFSSMEYVDAMRITKSELFKFGLKTDVKKKSLTNIYYKQTK